MYYIGIDIGSTSAKTCVLNEKKEIVTYFVQPTGWSSVETAEAIRHKLLDLGIDAKKEKVVATGYGRVAVPYADKQITEITCHAQGAMFLYHKPRLTVIDIGGQDTKIIQIEDYAVRDFIMNDKCSAGTGRFLEIMANTLGLKLSDMCELARNGGGVSISSMCTVFAESEVISLIGSGQSKENIAYAVVNSIVHKVASQASRMIESADIICLTGGLCECAYIKDALSKELNKEIITDPMCRYAGAIGAAERAMKIR